MKIQTELAGIERETIPDLDDVCVEWLEAKSAKVAAVERLADAEVAVQARLAEHNLPGYWYIDGEDRWLFTVERVDKTKVIAPRRRKGGGDGDEAELL